MASTSSGSRWLAANVDRREWRALRLTVRHVRRMFGAMAVTNELLLNHMKAMHAELAALTKQNRELRDRLTEVHAAVAARRRNQGASTVFRPS